MRKIAILTDSLSDMPNEMLSDDIFVLPLTFHFKGDTVYNYEDVSKYSNKDFYNRLNLGLEVIPVGVDKMQVFNTLAQLNELGYDVICLHASKYLAPNNAQGFREGASLAATKFKEMNIAVVDTETISFSEGLLVERASNLAHHNYNFNNIVDYITNYRKFYKTDLFINDYEGLFNANMMAPFDKKVCDFFKRQPVVTTNGGKVVRVKTISDLEDARRVIIERFFNTYSRVASVGIIHSQNESEALYVKDVINSFAPDVYVQEIDKCLGSVVRSKTLGLSYRRRS